MSTAEWQHPSSRWSVSKRARHIGGGIQLRSTQRDTQINISGVAPVDITDYKGGLGYAYAVAGERAEARKLLEELKSRSKQSYVPWFYIAGIYAGLGEKDQAIANLEKAYDQREQGLAVMKREPMFDPLRSDARFQELLRRMNLPLDAPAAASARN